MWRSAGRRGVRLSFALPIGPWLNAAYAPDCFDYLLGRVITIKPGNYQAVVVAVETQPDVGHVVVETDRDLPEGRYYLGHPS
jgi:hypothetical protein